MASEKKVFISYSSKNFMYVNEIVKVVKEAGLSCWKAPEMIPVGSNYAREIPNAIKQCDIFLIVISEESQSSIWVEKELDSAINNRKIIVPVVIDKSPLSEIFRFYLNNVQMINCDMGREAAMEKLKSRLLFEDGTDKIDESNYILETDSDTVKRKVKLNALSMNKIPVQCKYCGGLELKLVSAGTYTCTKCGKDNYDYYHTVKNYLEDNGPATAITISKVTGVPRKAIDYFLKEELVEIPIGSSVRLKCSRCQKEIRTGTICDECKINEAKKNAELKGKWHSGIRRGY